ncbi:MAG: protein phosphatase CheZ [Gammaproteobacteria bacterium]|nr:protein phosphatase CheZ [Gammaproteobacteria bacterium]MCF6363720.1 protein phosphatase CheZ [Gammaproteobacteria bacterium]
MSTETVAVNTDVSEDVLAHAEALVREMQAGNEAQVTNLLSLINTAREEGIYHEVGKMTRQLHDSLNSFSQETRLDALTEDEIPDARARLRHVITLTQKSADRSLSAVEKTLPKCDQLSERIAKLGNSWQNFKRREMSIDQFRALSTELEAFFTDAEQDTSEIRDGLNEIMMAQDFQDLTGQIISRVIELVEEVEGNLVELVRITGTKFSGTEEKDTGKDKKPDIEAAGPAIPGVGKSDLVSGQDEVDDLLSSLGF